MKAIEFPEVNVIFVIGILSKESEHFKNGPFGINCRIVRFIKGIDEEELNLIWDKYYKSDKTHSRMTIGTGIGLSIVKSILVSHNFDYGVRSKKHQGTTFYFRIKRIK